ncbi:protein of unknown function [Magnetospira sp. QH-2]|nr:protein of unknown function [Magnetospira sp. QH-2]
MFFPRKVGFLHWGNKKQSMCQLRYFNELWWLPLIIMGVNVKDFDIPKSVNVANHSVDGALEDKAY